jgi:hypothetical protein
MSWTWTARRLHWCKSLPPPPLLLLKRNREEKYPGRFAKKLFFKMCEAILRAAICCIPLPVLFCCDAALKNKSHGGSCMRFRTLYNAFIFYTAAPLSHRFFNSWSRNEAEHSPRGRFRINSSRSPFTFRNVRFMALFVLVGAVAVVQHVQDNRRLHSRQPRTQHCSSHVLNDAGGGHTIMFRESFEF